MNDNRRSIDWIDSGCEPAKKLRHENLAELGIAEAKECGEVSFCWTSGKTDPADTFTKEDNDAKHCYLLRDLMVTAGGKFCQPAEATATGKVDVGEPADNIRKECTDPLTHADIVNEGPVNQGPSPLTIGCAEN